MITTANALSDSARQFSTVLTWNGSLVSSPQMHWRWYVAPGCYFYVERAPNRFHRFMQRVFLGLHWERIS